MISILKESSSPVTYTCFALFARHSDNHVACSAAENMDIKLENITSVVMAVAGLSSFCLSVLEFWTCIGRLQILLNHL